MERAVLVYTTWPSIVEAERAGRAIVERRLAACGDILPGMVSHFWWQGKNERAAGGGRRARAFVGRRLAACVNILPGMVSHYWWQGKIERAEEVVMLVKTRAGAADAAGKAVKAAHSHNTTPTTAMP